MRVRTFCIVLALAVRGLLPAAFADGGATEQTFALNRGDVTEATLAEDPHTPGMWRLRVTLNSQKSADLGKFTADNLHKKVRLVVNGRLACEPVVQDVIWSSSMVILYSREEEARDAEKDLLPEALKPGRPASSP